MSMECVQCATVCESSQPPSEGGSVFIILIIQMKN